MYLTHLAEGKRALRAEPCALRHAQGPCQYCAPHLTGSQAKKLGYGGHVRQT